MSISQGPYKVIREDSGDQWDYYKLVGADGKTICDTFNSEVACIVHDFDDDSQDFDEQGREDMNAIAAALNGHGELLAALKVDLHRIRQQLYDVIAKANGATA